jgi:DNA-binding NarL/FixJ family response regulator
MTFWYLTNDLMFSSRFVGMAERSGHTVVMAAAPTLLIDRLAQSPEEPATMIIDLTLPDLDIADVVPRVRKAAPLARVVAYGPHVQVNLLAAAQAAGCDEVLSNGEFHRNMPAMLS